MRIPLFRLAHVAVDTLLCIVVYVCVYLLRFEGQIPFVEIRAFWLCLPILVGVRLIANYSMGIYSHLWKYVGVRELFSMIKAVALGSVLFVGITYLLGLTGFPRSIFVFEGAFFLLAAGGVRYSRRFSSEVSLANHQTPKSRTLIVGAGDAGAMVAADMLRRRETGFVPVGFIDDNPDKWQARIHDLRVFGPREKLTDVVESREIETIILAMPSASRQTIREYVALCQPLNIPLRIVPATHQILSGEVKVEQLRQLQIEDLLGRDPIRIEDSQLHAQLKDQTVLITGAGGSIGSELCRQILTYQPRKLLLLGHGENSIYKIVQELQAPNVQPIIADIRDQQQLSQCFQTHKPDQVFHAAAHKHVPLMEMHLTEAFLNNVLGSWTVLSTALQHGVKKAVLISTDKAAEPINIMGLSKYFAELVCHLLNAEHPDCQLNVVRFGNVIGSRGSVIPLFEQQIAQGGPLTLTDKRMTRYFMTIPEAVQLVLQASVLQHPAHSYILEMGEPIRILDLAENMIQLSGHQLDEIRIVETGFRPGEKLHETLVWQDEQLLKTDCNQIMAAQAAPERLNSHINWLKQILNVLKTAPTEFAGQFGPQLQQSFGLQLTTDPAQQVRQPEHQSR